MAAEVEVKYRCDCMEARAIVKVPARSTVLQLMVWLDSVVVPRVAERHNTHFPNCPCKVFRELMLPVSKDGTTGVADE